MSAAPPACNTGPKSARIAAAGTAKSGKRSFRVRYGPLNSITELFANVLETISAHWPAVLRHIHYFLPGAV
jgi:hypothetical protein